MMYYIMFLKSSASPAKIKIELSILLTVMQFQTVWLSFICGTQKMFVRMLLLLFWIQWK